MNVKIRWIVIFSLILSSCTKPLTLQLNDIKKQLVVYSVFCLDSNIMINITESKNMNEVVTGMDDFETVENAQVFIYHNNKVVDTAFYYTDGNYYSNTKPLENNYYQLLIRADGYDEVKAEGFIPTKVKIDSIVKTEIEPKEYNVSIFFTDPPKEDNYYCIYMSGITQYYSTNNPSIGEWKVTDNIRPLFTDKLFQGEQYEVKFDVYVDNYEHYPDSSKYIEISLYSLSKEYYQFLQSYNKQIPKGNGGDDLQQVFMQGLIEPIPIYSNIDGGLGIFAGCSISADTIFFDNN